MFKFLKKVGKYIDSKIPEIPEDEFWSEDGKYYYKFINGRTVIAKSLSEACNIANCSNVELDRILPMFDNIEYDLVDFMPTDSEGRVMDGVARFNGESYTVTVCAFTGKSYFDQIREQVHNQFNRMTA